MSVCVKQSVAQILVVVAITQTRTLRTDAGKGFMSTVVEHELVDTKRQANAVLMNVAVFEPSASSCVLVRQLPMSRMRIGLIVPNCVWWLYVFN